MFEENIEVIKNTFSEFKGTGMYIALFLISIIYIGIKEENKKVKRFIIYYSVITLLITLNPIFNKIVRPIFTDSVYWRVYWIIPLGVTIAYAAVKVADNTKGKFQKVFLIIGIVITIVFSGQFIYTKANYAKVGNLYKLPDEHVEIAQLIGIDEEEHKKAIVPETMIAHIRQIDATIELAYRRNPQGAYLENEIVIALYSGSAKQVAIQAEKHGCNYVVLRKEVPLEDSMEEYNFYKISETENFEIYKLQK